jgi:radical SAM protein with 4Fe4S-binding SPASM domain
VKALQVGFDAPYPDLFDRIVGRKGHFQRTVESIHNCADAGILVRTNSILTSESVKYINELVEFLYELPLFNMKIAAAFRSHYRGNTSILLDDAQKQWLRSQMIALREKHPDDRLNFECKSDYMHLSPEERAQEFRDFPTCGAGSQSIIITPNGDVVMCEQSPQIEEFIVGNVKTRSILDVWSSPNSREFKTLSQKQFAGTACADCGDFERCYIKKGGCFIETIKAYGSRFNPHPACPKAPEYAPPIR